MSGVEMPATLPEHLYPPSVKLAALEQLPEKPQPDTTSSVAVMKAAVAAGANQAPLAEEEGKGEDDEGRVNGEAVIANGGDGDAAATNGGDIVTNGDSAQEEVQA